MREEEALATGPRPGPLPDWLRPAAEAVLADFDGDEPLDLRLGYLTDLEAHGVTEVSAEDRRRGWIPWGPSLDSGIVYVLFRGGRYGFGIADDARGAELLVALAHGIQEHVYSVPGAWGRGRPACPDHTHPAAPAERDGTAWWTCPADGRLLVRIGAGEPPERWLGPATH